MSGLGKVMLDVGSYVTDMSVSSTFTPSISSSSSPFSGGEENGTPGPCGLLAYWQKQYQDRPPCVCFSY